VKKYLAITILVILVGLGIGGYLFLGQSSSEPPTPTITAGNNKIAVAQGSYCWNGLYSGKCVDMAAPPEIIKIKDLKPVVVSPENQLKIKFTNEPNKNTLGANRWISNDDSETVQIKNNVITAPKEKGIYVYDIFARWKNGSSSYVFVIEVQTNNEQQSKNNDEGNMDTQRLVQMLKNKGYEVIKPVKDNEPALQSLFSVYPTYYKVNGKDLGIYEFKDKESALKDSKTITKDGNIIGHGILEWVDNPHFYQKGKIIVSYIGSDFKLINDLEAILGKSITN
jgi:hypothetical protein